MKKPGWGTAIVVVLLLGFVVSTCDSKSSQKEVASVVWTTERRI